MTTIAEKIEAKGLELLPFCIDKGKLWSFVMTNIEAIGIEFRKESFAFVFYIPVPEMQNQNEAIEATFRGEELFANARDDRFWRYIANIIIDQSKPLPLPAELVDTANEAYWEYFHLLLVKYWDPYKPVSEVIVPMPKAFYHHFKHGNFSPMIDPVRVIVPYVNNVEDMGLKERK